jgi:hypothetical protein
MRLGSLRSPEEWWGDNMEQTGKLKSWIKEQAPMLAVLYENKYVGMAYDRFASLPPTQQRRLIFTVIGGVFGAISLYLLVAYYTLWSVSSQNKNAVAMGALLQQYQKIKRDKSQDIGRLEGNAILAGPGQFKQRLMDIGRQTGISPRMMEATEKGEASARSDEGKASTEVKIKQATVTLQKVTLPQIVNFLRNTESGQLNLNVSSMKIKADEQMRGYMNVEFQVMAYLFPPEEP